MSNKFDEFYTIRLATKEDIPIIMAYINEHWRENHIMAKDIAFFKHEYLQGENVNFLLAFHKEHQTIEAIYGFIKSCRRYESQGIVWGSIWKANSNLYNLPFLGVELAKRMNKMFPDGRFVGIGANEHTTVPIRQKLMKENVAKMNHYYYLNPEKDVYHIAVINDKKTVAPHNENLKAELVLFETYDQMISRFDVNKFIDISHKDDLYIKHRYFEHPYFKYEVCGVTINNEVKALLVFRKININNSSVLRIIDFIGNEHTFSYLQHPLRNKIIQENVEYLDMYNYGIAKALITEAGFIYRSENDTNIIPNYFEPFLQQNIDIWVHWAAKDVWFFKGDSDQDRPNLIR